MKKIGVLGAGHLGKIHIKCIQESDKFDLVGFYDPDEQISKEVISKYNIRRFNNPEELIDVSEIIDIVTPTVSHYESASLALKKFKHVFIEKPLTTSLDEAKDLISLAKEAGVKVQVGHVERFNPAFIAAQPYFDEPKFIEAHRLSNFNPRGTDVPVILDLMIHDIDIALSVVNSTIKRINASGVSVVSDTPDIANARIEFNNGCVANLTASRISMKNMRKSRFFQKDSYIAVDFLKKETQIINMQDFQGDPDPLDLILDMGEEKGKKHISIKKPEIEPINAIKTELETFYNSIETDTEPLVTIMDGYNSLEIAYKIMEKIDHNLQTDLSS